MENASKALIIAGAILLAIIIISLGIMVVNNARNQIKGADLSKEEIQSFNTQWEGYANGKKSSGEISGLFSAIIAHNAAETKNGTGRVMKVTAVAKVFNASSTALKSATPTSIPVIDSTTTYKVTPTYDTTTGLITLLTITK